MQIVKFLINFGFWFFVGAILTGIFLYTVGIIRENNKDKEKALYWKLTKEVAGEIMPFYFALFVITAILKVLIGA